LTAVNQSIAIEPAGAAVVDATTPAAGADTFQAGRVATIAAGHAVHDSYTAFLAPLLVIFKQTLGLSNTEAGLLSVFMQEASLAQPLIGGLADKFSVRYFVILAPAVTAIAMSLLGVAPSYLMLAILLTITGLSSACLHAVGPVMTGDVSGKRKLGMGMSIWMVGGESGRFIGPLVIGIVITTWGVQNTPWLMIGGVLASLALLLTLKEPPGHRAAQARPKSTLRAELRGKRRLLAVLIGIIVIQVFMSSALVTYLPILLHDEGGSFWLASVSLSVLQAAGVVGAMFGGTLSDRLGRRRMLSLSILPTSFFMFLFLTASGWVRFPLLLILGLTSLSITPVVMAIVQESFPNNRSLANGFYMALSFLIRSSAVLITGRLGDLFGMHTAFAVCAVVPLLGLPLLRFLPVKRAPHPAA
jgi:FSR family fosmidomycin resistance protein-like MFS transporter